MRAYFYSEEAKKIADQIRCDLPDNEKFYPDKTETGDSTLIKDLRAMTELDFKGVKDDAYRVDAISEIRSDKQRSAAIELRKKLKGYGRFFETRSGKELFVLEGVNLPEGEPSISQRIQQRLNKRR